MHVQLVAPPTEVVTLPGNKTDDEITQMLPEVLARNTANHRGRKLVLRIEDPS
jgi:hypothetical protein